MELLSNIFLFGAFAAIAGIVLTLLIGIFSMGRGGDFNRRQGHRLMRIRIGLQLAAVVLLVATALSRAA